MTLTQEQKQAEFLDLVQEYGKIPPKSAHLQFSDGGDVCSWYHNWCRYLRDFRKSFPNENLPKKFVGFYQLLCSFTSSTSTEETSETYSREGRLNSKAKEYWEKTLELGRMPKKKDNLQFTSGGEMSTWYTSHNQYYTRKVDSSNMLDEKDNAFLNLRKNLIEEGYYQPRKTKKELLTFEQKVGEYLEQFYISLDSEVVDKRVLFSDGTIQSEWYKNQNTFLRAEYKNQKVLSKKRMSEVYLFAKMENEMLKKKDIPQICGSRIKMSREDREKYFIKILWDLGKIPKCCEVDFPDGCDLRYWYSKNREHILELYPEIESEPLSFIQKIYEYQFVARQLGRPLGFRDSYLFSDRMKISPWFANQQSEIKKERFENGIISNLRMGELHHFALLEDFLFTLKRESVGNNKKILYCERDKKQSFIFYLKLHEYQRTTEKLNRRILLDDSYTFPDGDSMYEWYLRESSMMQKEYQENYVISPSRLQEIHSFALLDCFLEQFPNSEKREENQARKYQNKRL